MSNKIKIPDNAKWINSLAKEYDAAMFGDENWGKMSEDEQLALIGRMALFLGFYEPKIQALRDNNRALARALEVTTEGQIQENYCLVEDALAKHRELEPAGDEGAEATP